MIPFAVVGSERNVIVDGKPVRGRKTRWGIINVENEEHCEFNYLRNFLTRSVGPVFIRLGAMLIVVCRTHLQDLIEVSRVKHFYALSLTAVRLSDHRSGQSPCQFTRRNLADVYDRHTTRPSEASNCLLSKSHPSKTSIQRALPRRRRSRHRGRWRK